MFNRRPAPSVWREPKIGVFAVQNREIPRANIYNFDIGRNFFPILPPA
jgi:hypothetical protein